MSFQDFLSDWESIAILLFFCYVLHRSSCSKQEKKTILIGVALFCIGYIALQLNVAHEVYRWEYGDLIGGNRAYGEEPLGMISLEKGNYEQQALYNSHRARFALAAITGNGLISILKMIFRGTVLSISIAFILKKKRA